MGLATIGGILSGAGSFASGLSGLFGGDDGPGLTEQLNASSRMTARNAKAHILGVVQGAEAAGLHPLAALGMSGGGGASISWGDRSDRGAALEQMGQGLSRAAEAYTGKEERTLNRRLMALNVENAELQNQRLASEIALMRTAATPAMASGTMIPGQTAGSPFNLDTGVKVLPKEVTANIGSHELGVEAGTKLVNYGTPDHPFVIPVYAGQDDNEILMSLHAAGVSLPSAIHEWMRQNVKPSLVSGMGYARDRFYDAYDYFTR